jgi:hypothetical protein
VIDDGRLELIQHRGRKVRVRRMELRGGGLPWRKLTERGGCGGGCFDSGVVDCELRHRSGQKAMGSGGASCVARSEEKRGAGKRKQAMAALGAF